MSLWLSWIRIPVEPEKTFLADVTELVNVSLQRSCEIFDLNGAGSIPAVGFPKKAQAVPEKHP
jgi:hypothetical protein